ncbi:hypothetical protein RJ639_027458 [Escallonia herrerae]|uniref:Uncharacterized protein n=1 Tax=Escallonia herrerae TaxID=1293975 RepID=A0AA88X310_9ASTE|nr:hypothetical protein RJ639_027458 [Escallonia herrerae]
MLGPPGRKQDHNEVAARVDEVEREARIVDDALNHGGAVYLIGENEVLSSKVSSLGKRLVIDCGCNWLRRIARQQDEVFMIPRKRLVTVVAKAVITAFPANSFCKGGDTLDLMSTAKKTVDISSWFPNTALAFTPANGGKVVKHLTS